METGPLSLSLSGHDDFNEQKNNRRSFIYGTLSASSSCLLNREVLGDKATRSWNLRWELRLALRVFLDDRHTGCSDVTIYVYYYTCCCCLSMSR